MFGWIRRLFGEGYVYVTFQTRDGCVGRGRISYEGDPSTLDFDDSEFFADFAADIRFKYGKVVVPGSVRVERVTLA